VFNGYQRVVQTGGWADENDYKDFFIRASTKPIDGLMLAVDYCSASPRRSTRRRRRSDDSGERDARGRAVRAQRDRPTLQNDIDHFVLFEAEFTMVEGLKLMGEFAYTHQTIRTATPR